MSAVLRVKCVVCKAERDIGPDEVLPKDSVPQCHKCFSPMYAKSVTVKLGKKQ